ncbi:MAG: phosphopantothenoylcysteine decarboxylase [Verrucomicrobiota bacterium]
MSRLAVITCGPAFAPIDSVRRITNFATGEIGTLLAQELVAAGFQVVCFRGEGSTAPAPTGVDVRTFTTNDSLAQALKNLPAEPAVIFQAAALCDFEVAKIDGAEPCNKISSRSEVLHLELRPATKLLPTLRTMFPATKIVGWKYELDGTCDEAIAKARLQLEECRTDACILNGSAYGSGFGLVVPHKIEIRHFPDKQSLARELAREVR